MNIQRVNLQSTNQNVNFQAKINAPDEFWAKLKMHASEHVARRALRKIIEKPGTENQVINIAEKRLPEWFYDNWIWRNNYVVTLPSGKTMKAATAWVNWNTFLPQIAKELGPGRPHGKPSKAPLKPLAELIAEARA